jgi:hypothetical protein
MGKINIAKLLKNCPKGMKLDCLMFDNVTLADVSLDRHYPISIVYPDGLISLDKYGRYINNKHAKCIIFPEGKTTWEGFVPPCQFKDGDIVFSGLGLISIFKDIKNERLHSYVSIVLSPDGNVLEINRDWWTVENIRFATKEEKEELFKLIKDKGYKWNTGTKVLEKLVEPKFKVGDRIKTSFNAFQYDIIELTDTHYTLVEVEHKFKYTESIIEDKNWELVSNKFDISILKPFESKVLVRDYDNEIWRVSFWGCLVNCEYNFKFKYDTTRGCYKQCIPYEGNEYLLGKKDNCKDFYKTW